MAHLAAGFTRGNPDRSWALLQRRALFLGEVTKLAPHVVDELASLQVDFARMSGRRAAAGDSLILEWDELVAAAEDQSGAEGQNRPRALRDRLLGWARASYLEADWILSGAVQALAKAVGGRPLVLTIPTAVIVPPVSPPRWMHSVAGFDTLHSDYRERVLADFTRALDQHMEEVRRHLHEDPSVSRLEQVKRPTLKNIRHAVRWQVFGDAGVTSTARAIRKELRTVGLKPRPGLV